MDDNKILTVADRPKHHAIGRFFTGWDGQVYYCECYDPRADFRMVNIVDLDEKPHYVSPRAIGRTFHDVDDCWKPLASDEIFDREFLAVDTRVPPEQMVGVPMKEKDCIGLHERIALFFWVNDGHKFIKLVQEKAAKLKEKAATA